MRIGLIADIHGNLVALDTVLAELARMRGRRTDLPRRCRRPRATTPRGDRPLARAALPGRDGEYGCVAPRSRHWPRDRAPRFLPSASGVWRNSRPTISPTCAHSRRPCARTLPDGAELLCFHGSPRSFDDAIMATTPAEDLDAMLDGADAAIMVGRAYAYPNDAAAPGRADYQYGQRRFTRHRRGLAIQRDVHWAEYAVLDAEGDHTAITLHRTPLDVAEMVRVAHASTMPEFEWWSSLWRGE